MTSIIRKRKNLVVMAVASVVGVLISLAASQAVAQEETTLPAVQFGLIGIARAQTARLNVINVPPPDPEYPPNPCLVTLGFVDDQGAIFHDRAGNPLVARAEILPGESAFLELRAADALGRTTALRKQFRATIERRSGPVEYPPNPCDGIVPTLEVYDNFTGRTTVLYELRPGPISALPAVQ